MDNEGQLQLEEVRKNILANVHKLREIGLEGEVTFLLKTIDQIHEEKTDENTVEEAN